MKEKTGTKVGGVFLSIGINFTVFVGTLLLITSLCLLNVNYYKSLLINDTLVKSFRDYAEDNLSDTFDEYNVDSEDIYTDDFIKTFMGNFFDATFIGNNNAFDFDYYEDYCNNVIIPALEDNNDISFTKSEKRDLTSRFIDALEDSIDDIEENEDMKQINELSSSIKLAGFVAIGLAVLFTVIMIAIYRNKLRAIRNFFIASFIAMLVNTAAWGLIKLAFSTALEDSLKDYEKSLRPLFRAFIDKFMLAPVIGLAAATVICLVCIIVFAALASKAKDNTDSDDYIAPAPMAPVAPVAPAPMDNSRFMPQQPVTPVTPVAPAPMAAPVAPVAPVTPVTPAPVVPTELVTPPTTDFSDIAPLEPITPAPIDPAVAAPMAAAMGVWTCLNGHAGNTGNFCEECGQPKPMV